MTNLFLLIVPIVIPFKILLKKSQNIKTKNLIINIKEAKLIDIN